MTIHVPVEVRVVRFGARLFAMLASIAVLAAMVPAASASGPPAPFFQGFETDTSGWFDGGGFGSITRQPSGYTNGGAYASGIASATGGFHARLTGTCSNGHGPGTDCFGPYTLFGTDGFSDEFPVGGYTTELAIYLDVDWAATHPDVRFDWTSAIQDNTSNCSGPCFLSDYVFNAGTAPATGPFSGVPGFVIGASPNATRSGAFPENPCPNPSTTPNTCRVPVLITTSGWYTFRHTFRDDGSGNLAVDLTILDSSGTPVPGASWTIYQGFALSGVGGPAYGWFANEEIPDLAIDDSRLAKGSLLVSLTDFRDVRRPSDIAVGPDVCGTDNPSINLTGSAGAAGDTWITVYDTTPAEPDVQDTFGSISISADVLIKQFNNKKGAGVVALFNEGTGKKGLALVVFDQGNTDTLALGTVSKASGTFSVLKTASLNSAIAECSWYRLTMDVTLSGTTVSVNGEVLQHMNPANPNSGTSTSVGSLAFTASLPTGVDPTGEVGVVGQATSAVETSSVTNFTLDP